MSDRDIEIERANIIAARFWTSLILTLVLVGLIQWFRGATAEVQAKPALAIPAATPAPIATPLPLPSLPLPLPSLPSAPLDNLEEPNYPPDPNPARSA